MMINDDDDDDIMMMMVMYLMMEMMMMMMMKAIQTELLICYLSMRIQQLNGRKHNNSTHCCTAIVWLGCVLSC